MLPGGHVRAGHFRNHSWALTLEQLIAGLVNVGDKLFDALDDDAERALAGLLPDRNEDVVRVHQLGDVVRVDRILRVVKYQGNREATLQGA